MTATQVRNAGRKLLAALTEDQAQAACHPFTDDDRRRWTYKPRDRPGACIADLNREGRKHVHKLLSTVMSPHAFAQVTTIMGLEEVLDRAEGWKRGRHSDDFWIAIFGSPEDHAWSWRFEGHHVSITISIVGDELSPTPVFLGANPALISYRGMPMVRPLAYEEELARRLIAGLTDAQRREAIVSPTAPTDIRTGTSRDIAALAQLPGLRAADLAASNAQILDLLIDLYLDRLPPRLARIERGRFDPGQVRFAWEGSTRPGAGHYYRVQSPDLLLEYDNTQNDANHVHTVLRRPGDDFGARILAEHKLSE